MQHDLPAGQAYNCRYPRQRLRGKPRKRWIDYVKETCSKYNLGIRNATILVYERETLTAQVDDKKYEEESPSTNAFIDMFSRPYTGTSHKCQTAIIFLEPLRRKYPHFDRQ
jgi:hypothetical protein